MKTKYILTIDGEEYELKDDDLKNWDEIECSYKRSDYDGVVRSFTSKFSFVNRAYDLLMAVYLKDRYMANVSIAVYVMNDHWLYEKQFECPLDFSTIAWESQTLSINAVDNSLAAIIKANKSTTYEFEVGTEMGTSALMNFDRILMQESVTYEFTDGTSYEDCADLLVPFAKDEYPWLGTIGDGEIYVNGRVDYNDDQEDDGYVLKAEKDVEITLEYDLSWRKDVGGPSAVNLFARIKRNDEFVAFSSNDEGNGAYLGLVTPSSISSLGSYESVDDLPDANDNPDSYAVIDNIVWFTSYNGQYYYWSTENKTKAEQFVQSLNGTVTLNLKAGDYLIITHEILAPNIAETKIRFTSSSFTFEWKAIGDSTDIPVITPKKVIETLLNRMVDDDTLNVLASFSDHDSRLENTYLFAAESARAISGAKFYTSFSQFCDWMSTVFGYVYYIGDRGPSEHDSYMKCGTYITTPYTLEEESYDGEVDTDNIIFISATYARFVYRDGDKYYQYWPGWEDYNNPDTNHPYTDKLYWFSRRDKTKLYKFDEYSDGVFLYPTATDYTPDNYLLDRQTVYFVHRSELLSADADVRVFKHCRDLSYSVDSSAIYSSVNIGYDSVDYDSINGRDEFNFNNTYTTGCTVSDKELSLISKYRADCYGIEFAVQQQGEDTTDSSSDKDVFFVLCKKTDENLVPDKSMTIEGALSDTLFNGAFSPMACVKANAEYIGMQAASLELKFASSEGNSDIVIDGVAMSGDITIDTPLATPGVIEFTTDEVDLPDANVLMEVKSDGVVYRGFLQEVDLKYAKTEVAKYKIIVKDIEP